MRNLVRPVLGGLKSYLPGVDHRGTSGSTAARYCYAVWLRHLAVLQRHGVRAAGAALVELGPGDTLGLSLAALLSGARQATALDALPHAAPERDRAVLDDLVALFRSRAAPPGDDEYPNVRPRVPDLTALGQLVDDATLGAALAPDRLARLAREVSHPGGATEGEGARMIRYHAPWTPDAVAPGSADLVVSQAVLEYLTHDHLAPARNSTLSDAFATMHGWLRPGGVISHQIDFAAAFGPEWNAHWAVPDPVWALIVGRRPHYENRVPLSGYLELCARHGFEVLAAEATPAEPGVPRGRLARRFRAVPDADLRARGVHLVARKR
jgi:hypothetical protein